MASTSPCPGCKGPEWNFVTVLPKSVVTASA